MFCKKWEIYQFAALLQQNTENDDCTAKDTAIHDQVTIGTTGNNIHTEEGFLRSGNLPQLC